jgi:2-polyprenyl-3-methyl-5-hydroxy-6-metoxy-1,4-benzoquinol methylase
MSDREYEKAVRSCYSTWGRTYYDDYYGAKAGYPPVHRELIKQLLTESGAASVLDAGCGPASFLREIIETGADLYGFDLTPEMVDEAKRIFRERGLDPAHVWQGSVTEPADYQQPGHRPRSYDAAVCVGVLPHVPAEADDVVIENLRSSIRPGGLAVVEARNQLFALFTGNRYSYEFMVEELIRASAIQPAEGEDLQAALAELARHFRMDLPPVRKGKSDEPGYDEVLSRTHNPLLLREQFSSAGFRDVRVLFYHYHALPPMLSAMVPETFRRVSVAMENPADWRGHFMASAFLVAGTRA